MACLDKNKGHNCSVMKTAASDNEPSDDDTLEEESDEETASAMINKMSQKKKTSKSRANAGGASSYVLTKPIITEFGKKVMNYFHIPPRPTFLIGSLDKDLPIVQRKVRAKKAEKNVEQTRTKIKEIDTNSNEAETNSTVTEIERIYRILKKYFNRFKQGYSIFFYCIL